MLCTLKSKINCEKCKIQLALIENGSVACYSCALFIINIHDEFTKDTMNAFPIDDKVECKRLIFLSNLNGCSRLSIYTVST